MGAVRGVVTWPASVGTLTVWSLSVSIGGGAVSVVGAGRGCGQRCGHMTCLSGFVVWSSSLMSASIGGLTTPTTVLP